MSETQQQLTVSAPTPEQLPSALHLALWWNLIVQADDQISLDRKSGELRGEYPWLEIGHSGHLGFLHAEPGTAWVSLSSKYQTEVEPAVLAISARWPELTFKYEAGGDHDGPWTEAWVIEGGKRVLERKDDLQPVDPEPKLEAEGLTVTAYRSPRDGARVLQVDTENDGAHVRIVLNEAVLFDQQVGAAVPLEALADQAEAALVDFDEAADGLAGDAEHEAALRLRELVQAFMEEARRGDDR